jgi:hypothetical protein
LAWSMAAARKYLSTPSAATSTSAKKSSAKPMD